MNIAYKYRIYPNKDQIVLIEKTFGCCRKVWNLMLGDKISYYEKTGKQLLTTPAKYKRDYPFLKEADSLALANVQLNLERACDNFFRDRKIGFPRYKSKKHPKKSYTTNMVNGNIVLDFENKTIKLPKLGHIKAVYHRFPDNEWKVKSVTVSRNAINQYYVSVLFEYEASIDPVKADQNSIVLGLDYKSDGLYTDSEGYCAGMPHYYLKAQKKSARQQRKLSKKVLHSNNWYKQQYKVNKTAIKVSRQRRDFLHKQSKKIANSYDFVSVEDIDMKALSQSLKLGKATMDNGYGMFINMLSYKLEAKGGRLIRVDRFFPSTQLCSNCGKIKKIPLSQRVYSCGCGIFIDRDYNSAINITHEGKRLLLS
ncbi:MAG: transposase [Erysipelotrichaceae bacterium]|nr:transposase [Erysipelotrichaceae bacterium]